MPGLTASCYVVGSPVHILIVIGTWDLSARTTVEDLALRRTVPSPVPLEAALMANRLFVAPEHLVDFPSLSNSVLSRFVLI